MKRTETHSSQNGYYKASPQPGEVFVAPAKPTTFPTEVIPLALPVFLYNLTRFTCGDLRLIRLPQGLLVLTAALWATGWLPGGWWVTGLCLTLWVALQWSLRRGRQRNFVTFVTRTLPTVQPMRLGPKEKIPVHVTGRFGVENKQQRFTWLPGFYRTFATREHALLCQVRNRTFFWLGRWPEAEVGLWYIFFMPQVIQQVQWGELHFGVHMRPALAITYQPPAAQSQRQNRDPGETVYLAFTHADVGSAILADLLIDLPATVLTVVQPALTSPQ